MAVPTTGPRKPSLAETVPLERAASAPGVRAATIGEPFGPYVIFEKLGEGGMASVYRADLVGDNGLRKPVALKRMHTQCAEDPEFVSAFVHEAQLAAKLRHPNIAQAYDLGKIDDTYYIAMELVSGPTLAQIMNVAHQGAGAIPLAIALDILIQLCDALDHAHDLRDEAGNPLGLVHRDVSPMNVIVSKTGNVKLIDFGIAKVRSARETTQAGILKGKHAYIAPEYTYGQLDHRVDLFALGVVAHELLTTRRLFASENEYDTIKNVRVMPIPPPSRFAPGLSPQLDAIVLKALERDPEQRWQTAGEMRAALIAEVRRIGAQISGKQIRDWADWAFKQTPRRNSSVDRMLDGLEPSISISMAMAIEEECPPVSARPSQAAIAYAPTERAQRPGTAETKPARRLATGTTPPPRAATAIGVGTPAPRKATGTTPAPRKAIVTARRADTAVPTGVVPKLAAPTIGTPAQLEKGSDPISATSDPFSAMPSEVVTAVAPSQSDLAMTSEMVTAVVPRALSPASLDIPSEVVTALAPHVASAAHAPLARHVALAARAPSPSRTASPAVVAAMAFRAPSPSRAPAVPMIAAGSVPNPAAPSAPMIAAGSAPASVASSAPIAAPRAQRFAAGSGPSAALPAGPIVAAAAVQPARRRAPAWRAPTRWAHPPKRRSAAPFVLLALIAIAAVLVSTGTIDIDAWREILATYLG